MFKVVRLFSVFLFFTGIIHSTAVLAQSPVSHTEKTLNRKLERNFKRYHRQLQHELADFDFLQNQLKLAQLDSDLRDSLIDDYEDYLKESIKDGYADGVNSSERQKLNELYKELTFKRRTKEGKKLLLEQYSILLSENLVVTLDGFYRNMIMDMESFGNYELARAMIESKKEINSADVVEAISQLLSRENLSFTRELIQQKIKDAGGIQQFKKNMRAERRKSLKWGCVSLKILAGAAVIPFSVVAMKLGVMTAPIFMGQLNLYTLGAVGGSLGAFTVSAASINKLISGCYRETSQFDQIDGYLPR